MDPADKAEFVALHPDDPHAAAAAAWEHHAASLPVSTTDGVSSVNTGAQSVSYKHGGGEHDVAIGRANWHRSRAKVRSVAVGPEFSKSPSAEHDPPQDQVVVPVARTMTAPRVAPAPHDYGDRPVWQPEQP